MDGRRRGDREVPSEQNPAYSPTRLPLFISAVQRPCFLAEQTVRVESGSNPGRIWGASIVLLVHSVCDISGIPGVKCGPESACSGQLGIGFTREGGDPQVWLAGPAGVTATALHVPDLSTRPLPERLADRLAERQCLTVLDDCEYLVGARTDRADALLSSDRSRIRRVKPPLVVRCSSLLSEVGVMP